MSEHSVRSYSHDCPRIDAEGLAPIEQLAQQTGISLVGEGRLKGWTGGRVVLVPTIAPSRKECYDH
jgi:2',3'-cyclic-nucleotide 3'-phosphodiesterase